MRVASTKLTNPDWEKLQDKCNKRGLCIAEHVRNLIRLDLDSKESSPSEDDNEAERSQSRITSKSGITSIFGKRSSDGSQLRVTSETKTEVGQIQQLLQEQSSTIQHLSDQLKEIGDKVVEQDRRQKQLKPQPSMSANKTDCVYSSHSPKFNCYNLNK